MLAKTTCANVYNRSNRYTTEATWICRFGTKDCAILDVPYERLIDSFEKKYGEIILDSCDINTNLGVLYNCYMASKASREIFSREYLLDERNRIISEKVKSSPVKKILLIYGLNHLKGIKEFLENN